MIKRILKAGNVDDDREVFKKAFHHINPEIEIIYCNNGAEALSMILVGGKPDIIFLDHFMPVMDGIECLTKLKANRNTRKIPVIMYTRPEENTDNDLAIRLGAFEIVRKSLEVEVLSTAIKRTMTSIERSQ
jgi:CheY-like chemotaxis protein